MRQLLVACSRHIQEHLRYGGMQIGMEAKTKQVQAMLRDLRSTVKALNLAVATQERVEQAQREQEQRDQEKALQQAAEERAQVAQIEADKKAETERYRIDRQHEVDMHKLELERETATARAGLAAEGADADRVRKDAEAAARIERERKMLEARADAARAIGRMNAVQDATGFSQTRPGDLIDNENPGTGDFRSL